MKEFRSVAAVGSIVAVTLLGLGVAQADSTAGSLVVPPESIGPQTFSYSGTGDTYSHFFPWPNYLSEVREGTVWRLDVLGIDVSGLTGPDGRAARFQLTNVMPIGGTIYDGSSQQWTSLMFNVKLDAWGDDMDKDLFQLQESYQVVPTMPGPDWYGFPRPGLRGAGLT